MGEGVGSRPHDGPRPPSVRSSHPVSIEMPDSLIEELPRDVSRLASLVLHSAGKQPRPRRLRRCRQTGGPTAVRHMTHLGEPQSAAGVPALVPDHRADQPRLARMGALLKEIRCQEIRCQFTIQEEIRCQFIIQREPERGNPVSVKRKSGVSSPFKEIRCRFIILARKDEPTADYARHRITRKDELTLDYAPIGVRATHNLL